MRKPQNIFLIGPMGAGKSTIGKHLAQTLGLAFIDSDSEIEARTGADISWIFDVEGEEGFRKREQGMINELTQRTGIVLATGGGSVLKPENRNVLGWRGFVIYLYASLTELLERTTRDRTRPLLQNEHPESTLEGIMHEREPLYQELADMVVNTDGRTAKAVCNEIIKAFDES